MEGFDVHNKRVWRVAVVALAIAIVVGLSIGVYLNRYNSPRINMANHDVSYKLNWTITTNSTAIGQYNSSSTLERGGQNSSLSMAVGGAIFRDGPLGVTFSTTTYINGSFSPNAYPNNVTFKFDNIGPNNDSSSESNVYPQIGNATNLTIPSNQQHFYFLGINQTLSYSGYPKLPVNNSSRYYFSFPIYMLTSFHRNSAAAFDLFHFYALVSGIGNLTFYSEITLSIYIT